jgi:acyl-CoA dehydrogenase
VTNASQTRRHRSWVDDEVQALGQLADQYLAANVTPYQNRWDAEHRVSREVWREAGKLGLLLCSIPEQYGGGGGTFAHELAVMEAQGRAFDWAWGNIVHSGIVAHYLLAFGTEEQRQRWLHGMATGELVSAIAMTEPDAGSDLKTMTTRADRQGDHYVINGAKTFISNGATADLVLVAAKTDPRAGARGISLIMVEVNDCDGFTRGRILDKLGQHGADTSELHFTDASVPAANLLGAVEGRGFAQLMEQLPQERLCIAVMCAAAMERAVTDTAAYVKSRNAFGGSLFDLQNTRFVLAEALTTAMVSRAFADECVTDHLAGRLSAQKAAMAKWWLTDRQFKLFDDCVQLLGGYGYMREYPLARAFIDSRVQRVYGGANEVMKDVIAREI